MLISKQKKFLFVHIPRTGGNSIRKILVKHIPDSQEFIHKHDHAIWAKTHLGSSWKDYYKFTFVRNPWARILSWYRMIKQMQTGNISEQYRKDALKRATQNKLWLYVYENSNSFEEFLLKCTAEIEDADGKRSFAYNQLDYISDENGNIIVDYIGKYENYTDDIQVLCNELGLGKIELPHVWGKVKSLGDGNIDLSHVLSKPKHYSYYYNETCKQIVAERFAKDIEYFGYTFESKFE